MSNKGVCRTGPATPGKAPSYPHQSPCDHFFCGQCQDTMPGTGAIKTECHIQNTNTYANGPPVHYYTPIYTELNKTNKVKIKKNSYSRPNIVCSSVCLSLCLLVMPPGC